MTASWIGVPGSTVGPCMPRLATRIPVAFATIAFSNDILVPSANVHHRRFHSPFFGEPLLRRGIAIWVMQAFNVAAQHWSDAQAFYPPVQVHDDAGLVALRIRDNDAGVIGVLPSISDRVWSRARRSS